MDEQIARLEAILAAAPRDIDAHLKLADQWQERAQAQKASQHNLTAARLLAASGRIPEGIEVCQRALRQDPTNTEAALLLANLYARRPGEGHAARVVEVLDRPAQPQIVEALILLSPADAVEELAPQEIEDLSVDEVAIPEESVELEELAELEEIDELEAARIEGLDTTEREVLKWEYNTTQISLAEVARQRRLAAELVSEDPLSLQQLHAPLEEPEPAQVPSRTRPISLDTDPDAVGLQEMEARLASQDARAEDPAQELVTALYHVDVTTAEYGEEEKHLALMPEEEADSPSPPPHLDEALELRGDEELELNPEDLREIERRETIRPEDVLEVIDASDDAFLGRRAVFSSGRSHLSALDAQALAPIPGAQEEPPSPPAGPAAAREDGFDAIADLIQHSLDTSLAESIDEQTTEFHSVSRGDIGSALEPPVPGWSRPIKYTRPPEALTAPPGASEGSAPWSSRALEEALRAGEEPSEELEIPAQGEHGLTGEAAALLSRLSPAQPERVARWLRRRRFSTGAIILREGVPHHSLFLIEAGGVVFERRIATGRQKVAAMGAGQVFGEFELLLQRAPRVQIRATQDTLLLELTERALADLSISTPQLWETLWDFYQQRLVASFLTHGSLFASFSPSELAEIARAFVPRQQPQGEVMIRQGVAGMGLYLICAGEVVVSHQQQERRTVVANLREGNFFCSLSQLAQEPIMASVEAREEVKVMVLPHEILTRLIREHAPFKEALGRLVSYRQIVVGKTNYSRIGVPG